MSAEHYVSHAILRRLESTGGQLMLSKFPWMKGGESQVLPSSRIAAKVLCTAHNSALSPLDALGDRVCALLLKTGEPARPGSVACGLFNGEDFERWLLKTLCGVAAMEALARGVAAAWQAPLPWLEALFGLRDAMPGGTGLWVNFSAFVLFPSSVPSFSATPIDDPGGGPPLGLRFNYSGFEFVLLMSSHGRSRWVPEGRLRPSLLSFYSPSYCGARIGLRYKYAPPGMHLRAVELPATRANVTRQ